MDGWDSILTIAAKAKAELNMQPAFASAWWGQLSSCDTGPARWLVAEWFLLIWILERIRCLCTIRSCRFIWHEIAHVATLSSGLRGNNHVFWMLGRQARQAACRGWGAAVDEHGLPPPPSLPI